MTLPRHRLIPDPTTGYALNPERGWVSVYLPAGTTNLFLNPSFERGTATWTASSDGSGGTPFARVADAQFRGAWSGALTVRPTGGTFVQIVGGTNATAGQAYALQCHVKRPGATDVDPDQVRAVVNGQAVPFQTLVYVADGWWRGEYVYTATGSNPAGVRILGAPGQITYVDALQWEQASECSTYVDGDELGLIPGEQPPAYSWNGAPHASTATRSATTRAGGLRRNLDRYGLTVLGLIGLGQPPQQNQTIAYAGQDGSFYQGARRPERGLTIAGAFQGRTPQELDRMRRDVRAALTFDAAGPDSPVVLELQAHVGTRAIGEAVTCVCSYVAGMESSQASLYAEKVSVQLVEHIPGLTSLASRGGALSENAQPSMTYLAILDARRLEWAFPTGLNAQPQPNAVIFGPDERLYVGGAFTAPGNRVAAYSFVTGAWETLSTGLGAQVNALAFDRQGRLWAGGAPGLITGSTVAIWNGATWAAAGALTATVTSLAYDAASDRMFAGGQSGANAALYRSPATSPSWTTITAAAGTIVNDLAFDPGLGTLYIAGDFSNLGGVSGATHVARYTFVGGIAAMGGGADAAAYSVTVDARGRAWFSGDFVTFAGVSVSRIARWTGQAGEAIPGVVVAPPDAIVQANPLTGEVWAGGVELTAASGVGFLQRLSDAGPLWPGLAINEGATLETVAVAFSPARIAVARDATGSSNIRIPDTGIVTNPGTLPAPVVVVQRVTSLTNLYSVQGPTGAQVDLAILVLDANDTLTVDSRPERLAVATEYQGDIRARVRLGSQLSGLVLPPGVSSIRAMGAITAAAYEGSICFRPRYGALGDAAR